MWTANSTTSLSGELISDNLTSSYGLRIRRDPLMESVAVFSFHVGSLADFEQGVRPESPNGDVSPARLVFFCLPSGTRLQDSTRLLLRFELRC